MRRRQVVQCECTVVPTDLRGIPSTEEIHMIMQSDRWGLRTVACTALLIVTGMTTAKADNVAEEAAASNDSMSATGTNGAISSDAQAVLDRMRATFGSLQQYAITARITRDEMLPFGYKLQNNESARMWVKAPNRLRLEVEGDIKHRTYVYDGSQLTMFVPDLNVYAATAAPDTLGELVRTLLDIGVEMPLIDMLYHGNAGSLTSDVRVGRLVGESEVDGVPTDHLAFRQPNVDWQLWVQKGEQALPRKLLITTRYVGGDPQYQAVLTWDLKPRITPTSFSFAPPSSATKVPYYGNLIPSGGDQ